MGPSKLEVEDIFKIYFVSPNCIIAEVFSYMSGFMMMDTFYSILQYKYDITYNYDETNGRMIYDAQLSINFGIEFIKDNWFKTKILTEAQADVDEFIKMTMIPNIIKVSTSQAEKYNKKFEEYKRNKGENMLIEELPIQEEISLPQVLMDKEIEICSPIINNIVKHEQNGKVSSPDSDLTSFVSLSINENKYIKLSVLFLTLLILFLLFPFNTFILITVNLILLYAILLKLDTILNKLSKLEHDINKLSNK
jgi:hypothetical protein